MRYLFLFLLLIPLYFYAFDRDLAEEIDLSSGETISTPLPTPNPSPSPTPDPNTAAAPGATPSPISDDEKDNPDRTSEIAPPAKPSANVSVGARIDAGFSAGGPIDQGFSIPALRFWAMGTLGNHVGYRFSLAQTREFSSVMIPQLAPVEAYALVGDNPDNPTATYLRVGMFRPKMNPLWSSDLAMLSLPDYFQGHRALFFSNDIGVEAGFEPLPNRLEVSLGAMNGNGAFALNTNSTRAMTVQIKAKLPSVRSGTTFVGWGAGRLLQSVEGSVSYKNEWISNLFLTHETKYFQAAVLGTWGEYEDSVISVQPVGIAAWLSLRPIEEVGAFILLENHGPLPDGGNYLFHSAFGPSFQLGKMLQVFLSYDIRVETKSPATEREDTGQIRVRVAL